MKNKNKIQKSPLGKLSGKKKKKKRSSGKKPKYLESSASSILDSLGKARSLSVTNLNSNITMRRQNSQQINQHTSDYAKMVILNEQREKKQNSGLGDFIPKLDF